MKGKLIRITNSKGFITLLFKLEGGKYGRTYTGRQYRNYAIWHQFMKDDWVEGLLWIDEKKGLLDGDSPVHLAC